MNTVMRGGVTHSVPVLRRNGLLVYPEASLLNLHQMGSVNKYRNFEAKVNLAVALVSCPCLKKKVPLKILVCFEGKQVSACPWSNIECA